MIKNTLRFFWSYKWWWLAPIALVFLAFLALVLLTGEIVAPFVYAVF